MIKFIFEWVSTILFLIGGYLFTSKKANNPKIRAKGLIFYTIGGLFYIYVCLILQTYGFILVQSFFTILDIRGIYNCYLEIKNDNNT